MGGIRKISNEKFTDPIDFLSYFFQLGCAILLELSMDKLKLTGQALGRVFNFRSGCMHTMHLLLSVAIRPNLELKTRSKQLLGSLPLVITLPKLLQDFLKTLW